MAAVENGAYPEIPRYYVSALGIRTAYYATGNRNGRSLLLLHGMSTSGDSFRELMHELADEYWLVAPDIPGFGFSNMTHPYTVPHLVEWIAALREALSLPPGPIVGHSFGGMLAAGYALAYPEEVTRLLLVAPALMRAETYPPLMKRVGFSLRLVDMGITIAHSPLFVRRQIKTPFYDPAAQPESMWKRRLRDYSQARGSTAVVRAVAFHELRPSLHRIRQPVCLVWGEEDPVVPIAEAAQLRTLLPAAELHKIPRCGHAPILEHRDHFLTIARQFLAG